MHDPITLSPAGTMSDGIEELDDSPTRLFYHDTGRPGPTLQAFRVLPLLTRQALSGKGKQSNVMSLSPGWSGSRVNRVVNVFLEGEYFTNSALDRHSYLHLRGITAPDFDALCLGDLRRELAHNLDIEDSMMLQLEVQHALAMTKGKIFKGGKCTRFNAAWNDVSVDDRTLLSKVLVSRDAWIRVRVAEIVKIHIASKDITIGVTPSRQATSRQMREMVASVAESTPGAVSLLAHYELDDTMSLELFINFNADTTINATIETRECVNCLDDVGTRDFPFEPTTEECGHDLHICRQCVSTWIGTSLDNGNWKIHRMDSATSRNSTIAT